MHKNITLIIPTYNRYDHLNRLLAYYSSLNPSINFLILDSSNQYYKNKNQDLINGFTKNMAIVYRPYENIDVIFKIRDGISAVKTKYCALCADDDLIFLDVLADAAYYLENNKNTVCVDGIYLNFTNNQNALKVGLEYSRNSINNNNRFERIFSLMQKYESLYYGVYRSEDLKLIFESASGNDNLHFQELHQSVSALLLGEHCRLNKIYGARQNCTPADSKRENWQTTYWFSEDSVNFMCKYSEYIENIYKFYTANAPTPHISRHQFNHFINVSHAIFFSKACDIAYMHKSLSELWPDEKFKIPGNVVLKIDGWFIGAFLLKLSTIFNLLSMIFLRLGNSFKGKASSELISKKLELERYCSYGG